MSDITTALASYVATVPVTREAKPVITPESYTVVVPGTSIVRTLPNHALAMHAAEKLSGEHTRAVIQSKGVILAHYLRGTLVRYAG